MASLSDRFADAMMGRAVEMERVAEGIRRQVLSLLRELEIDLVATIDRFDIEGVSRLSAKYRRAEAMLTEVRSKIGSGYKDIAKTVRDELVDLAQFENGRFPRLLNQVIGADLFTPRIASRGDLRALVNDMNVIGGPLKEWWAKQATDTAQRFATQVRMGVAASETNQQIVQRIRGRRVPGTRTFTGGVMPISARDAHQLVRTSVQTVNNAVIEQTYQQNADILRGQQWLATLDLRTSQICIGLSGASWDMQGNPLPDSPKKIAFPGPPPAHRLCRSTLLPLTKTWSQLIEEQTGKKLKVLESVPNSTRASMDGQVAGDLTYEQWLRGKSVAQQKEVLGPGKWQLWNEGKITLPQLVDQSAQPLTVAQLRAVAAAPSIAPVAGEAAPMLGPVFPRDDEPRRIARYGKVRQRYRREAEAAYATLREDWLQIERQLAEKQKDTLEHYLGGSFGPMNQHLRALPLGELPGPNSTEGILYDLIHRQPPLKRDMLVWRFSIDLDLEVGQVHTLRGFISTSTIPIESFFDNSEVGYEILLPRGSRGALAGSNRDEFEIILQHESKFRVVSKKTLRFNDGKETFEKTVYQLEYIPPEVQ